MFNIFLLWFGALFRLFPNRRDLVLENFVLRHQLGVLGRRRPRPSLSIFDKLLWVAVSRLWSGWKQALIVVTPETVVRWHRAGFRLYWKLISRVRRQTGRRQTPNQVRLLIFRMVAENPTWGAPRIHGELLMLGFDISERTISRWMKRAPRDPRPAKRWLAFLRNHQEAIAAMDFFTVPTITFGVLYGFFVIAHDRRRILHCNVTKHPTSLWVVQQLREAFPYESAPRFLIFDRDGKYGVEVPAAVRSLKITPVRTSFESPWQNGVAERWVESCRRDLLDHVIAVNERHLKTCSPNTSAITTKTVRISDLGKEHRMAELVPWLAVASFLTSESAACIIATIRLRRPVQIHVYPYLCVGRTARRCPPEKGVPALRNPNLGREKILFTAAGKD